MLHTSTVHEARTSSEKTFVHPRQRNATLFWFNISHPITHHDVSTPLENHVHSNMGGGALTGYASDLETRMRIHKGEVGDADTKEALKNLDLANKKLDMPGIISFP